MLGSHLHVFADIVAARVKPLDLNAIRNRRGQTNANGCTTKQNWLTEAARSTEPQIVLAPDELRETANNPDLPEVRGTAEL